MARKDQREIFDAFSVNTVGYNGSRRFLLGWIPKQAVIYNQAIEKQEWEEISQCALTALCVQSRGGIPSIPSKDDVELFIRNNRKRCSYD